MEDVLHHLGCLNPPNNGICSISTGEGFLPSNAPILSELTQFGEGKIKNITPFIPKT